MSPTNTVLLAAIVALISNVIIEAVKQTWRQQNKRFELRVEIEYKILRELWNKAYWLKSRANQILEVSTEGADDPESIRRRLSAFELAKDECRNAIFLHKPFYPSTVFEVARKLETECADKALDFQNAASSSQIFPASDIWDRHREFNRRIDQLTEDLGQAIRQHLQDQPIF